MERIYWTILNAPFSIKAMVSYKIQQNKQIKIMQHKSKHIITLLHYTQKQTEFKSHIERYEYTLISSDI